MKSTLFLRFIFFHSVVYALMRTVFFLSFQPTEAISSAVLWKSFFLGARFDLRLICLLLLPMVLLAWRSWSLQSKSSVRLWSLFYTALAAVWMAFFIFDFGFYGYLNSRMNSSALLFLENPDISLGMLWQSYPVMWVLLGYFVVLAAYLSLLRRCVFRTPLTSLRWGPGWVRPPLFMAVFVIGLYGQISQYPLRWSEAFFSPHHFASHLALNPVLYFFESYEFSNKKEFDLIKVKDLYPVFSQYLGVTKPDVESLSFARKVSVAPRERAPNVVIIVMESLALSKTNLGENPLKPTPALESLAQESLWFSNYFSPSEGTARNIFSVMTAIPDVTKVQTSTRNPLVVDQQVIANAYKNYRKMYFVGGSASWANIRGIFSHNIEDIEIFEEGAFDKSKTDVWGVSDLDLFIEAHDRFEKSPQDKPFFAVIQSASFHRPYTIPQNAKDFQKLDVPVTTLKEAGFYSLEQFNSLRFSDYSLGHFFELAKKSRYYQNTLFVITGDHGLPDEGGVNVSAGMQAWELEKYHVPLILHHSKYFAKSQKDERPAGHLDLMTSTAAAAGVSHINTTLGRNLFDSALDHERYAFVYNYYSELNEYGLINENFYLHYDDKNGFQLFERQSQTPQRDVQNNHPQVFSRMKTLAEGYLQSGRYLLFHNQKKGADRNQPQK